MFIEEKEWSKQVFITFHTEKESERLTAENIAAAVEAKVITFKELLTNNHVPADQARIIFHGHGSPEMFGSLYHHYSAKEFAEELISLLKNNPKIKDIDLLSCNLGLIDKDGSCYAGIVQSYLDEAGFDYVSINTFLVDNKNDDILDSFFIVGMSDASDSFFLNKTQFSLDLLKKENKDQVNIHDELHELEKELYLSKVIIDLLTAIRFACKEDHVTLNTLTEELHALGYNKTQIDKIVKDYNVKLHDTEEDIDPYFTCNIIDPKKKYQYANDTRDDINALESQIYSLSRRHEELSRIFAKLRSESKNTRILIGDIKNIQNNLASMHMITHLEMLKNIEQLTTLKNDTDPKILGKNILSIVNAHKTTFDVKLLDIYAKNLATVFLNYKSRNTQRISALNMLAMQIGQIYSAHLDKSENIDDCIDRLKTETRMICEMIKDDHKHHGTFSFQGFSGGKFSLTQSSLAKNLGDALLKSDKAIAEALSAFKLKETIKL